MCVCALSWSLLCYCPFACLCLGSSAGFRLKVTSIQAPVGRCKKPAHQSAAFPFQWFTLSFLCVCVCLFCFVSSLTFPFKKVEFVFSKRIFWRLIGLPPGVIKQLVRFFFFKIKNVNQVVRFIGHHQAECQWWLLISEMMSHSAQRRTGF